RQLIGKLDRDRFTHETLLRSHSILLTERDRVTMESLFRPISRVCRAEVGLVGRGRSVVWGSGSGASVRTTSRHSRFMPASARYQLAPIAPRLPDWGAANSWTEPASCGSRVPEDGHGRDSTAQGNVRRRDRTSP